MSHASSSTCFHRTSSTLSPSSSPTRRSPSRQKYCCCTRLTNETTFVATCVLQRDVQQWHEEAKRDHVQHGRLVLAKEAAAVAEPRRQRAERDARGQLRAKPPPLEKQHYAVERERRLLGEQSVVNVGVVLVVEVDLVQQRGPDAGRDEWANALDSAIMNKVRCAFASSRARSAVRARRRRRAGIHAERDVREA
ncbi:unnamed protein product [Chondrus crispus]|uniref:Uncharacterized protein n=1 Tax=Chondrus crispus TaxID=2769 RepID=R7Q2T1_CHOCR|nr:unnamed protein product [Chondrus crispus]CDF32198.1 unnamed protein product [Chondrus crispus]|eukprot:XP_005711863.1 unnamed protein product [Chondrus crispus]